jgi:hypothetical protein
MVTEWEREELCRLTHSNLKSFSQQQADMAQNAGRMTLQNIEQMKIAQKKTETKEAKIKLLLDRLKMAVTTSLSGLFRGGKSERSAENICKVYGHNLPWGTNWKGAFPKCLDCGSEITEASQLRGAVPKAERDRFRGYSEK